MLKHHKPSKKLGGKGWGIPCMRLERNFEIERGARIFQNCYHTTLVGVLYCATAMNSMKSAKRGDLKCLD